MAKKQNSFKRISDYTDCTDGPPEHIPYIRRTSENEIYYFAASSRHRSNRVIPSRLQRLLLGLVVSSVLIFLTWLTSKDSTTDNHNETHPPLESSSISRSEVNLKRAASKPPKEIIFSQLKNDSLRMPKLHLLSQPTKETITYTVDKNDTWSTVLEKNKLNADLSRGIYAAIDTLKKTEKTVSTKLKVGKQISINLKPNRDIENISIDQTRGKFVLVQKLENGNFQATLNDLPSHFRQFVATGRITSSLSGDAAKVGVAYDIIDDFVDMFSDRVVFHQDLHTGDRFTLLFEDKVLEDGTSLGQTNIVAASLLLQGERMAAIRFRGQDGTFRYFNEKGELLGDNFLRYPLKFSRISSLFSDNRMHPVLNVKMPHNGVDFVAPIGTPIRSVAQGTVISSGWSGACGKMVKIQHNPRYSTAYCHLQSIPDSIVKGAKVQRGGVIGTLGATGRVTGAHLHYVFYDNDNFADPLKMKLPTIELLDLASRIPKTYLKRAMQTIEDYQQIDSRNFRDENIRLTHHDLNPSSNDDVFSIFTHYLNKLARPSYEHSSLSSKILLP